tara:strand:- start:5 stop:763 length:759 start_codon:yes stop_codon:yes gene_type:complete
MKHIDEWYEVTKFSDGVSLIREKYVADWLRCNIWHIQGKNYDLLIDSGMGLRPLKKEIITLTERPVTVVSTHCHFDHIGGAHEFDCRLGHRLEASVHANPTLGNTATTGFVRAETFKALPYEGFVVENYRVKAAPLTGYLDEGDVVDLGNRHFHILHLPGHSPGSIALYEKATETLFSGDVIYDGALYDTVYHSDKVVYRESLERLKSLKVKTIHGGHDQSFGPQRMIEIIEGYLAGNMTLGDPAAWVGQQI